MSACKPAPDQRLRDAAVFERRRNVLVVGAALFGAVVLIFAQRTFWTVNATATR